MTENSSTPERSRAAALARTLAAAGHHGPLLIVADNASIGRRARAWADVFGAHGWLHRVRLCEGGADLDEITALVREANGLGATAIIGSGGEPTRSAGAHAAARAGLPFIPDVSDDDAPAGDTRGADGRDRGRIPCDPTPRD